MHRFPRILLGFLATLPLSVLHALGSVLGWTIYGISPTYRRHLRENLEGAGYRDARVRHAAIAGAGQMMLEAPAIWLRPQARVVELVREERGYDEALAAHARGKAVLLLTPHMGCFEIAAQYTSQGIPLTALYRPPRMRWLDPVMREGRQRGNIRLVPTDLHGVREVLAAIKRREAIGFLPDQVPGKGEGEWADFFGRPAYTVTFAAKLAARDDVACFLVFARRLPRGAGYALLVRALPPVQPGETPVRHLNRALEELVRECPEQYLWGYHRYKTPSGAKARPA